jgi:hypothetical protein
MLRKVLISLITVLGVFFISAAEVTDVASSFDYKNPFDFNLDVQFLSTQHFGSIKREYNTDADYVYEDINGSPYYTTESRRVETKEYGGNPHLYMMRKLLIGAEIGLYHNLSLSFDLPIIFQEEYKMVANAQGDTFSPGEMSLPGQGLFPWDGNLDYSHKGVGDIAFGLQWAPFHESRKNRFFSWLLGMKVTFPTAAVKTPVGMNVVDGDGNVVPSGKKGNVGEGVFKLDFRTAVSKRYGSTEPYLQFLVSIPVNSKKSIYENPKEAIQFNFGTEINFYENKDLGQKIHLRTDIELLYTTKGNSYNSISNARWVYDDADTKNDFNWNLPVGEDDLYNILPFEDPWAQISGMLKLNAKVYKYIAFGGFAKLGYRHKHYLTNAKEGNPGFVTGLDDEKTEWISNSGSRSKLGGRLMAESYLVLDWGVNLTLLF